MGINECILRYIFSRLLVLLLLNKAFMYGNLFDDAARNEAQWRLPRLLAAETKDFSLSQTLFNNDKQKAGTGRRSLGGLLAGQVRGKKEEERKRRGIGYNEKRGRGSSSCYHGTAAATTARAKEGRGQNMRPYPSSDSHAKI